MIFFEAGTWRSSVALARRAGRPSSIKVDEHSAFAVFYSYYRCPAAYPLFFAVGKFGRQNQDHLQLTAGNDARIGIEKDAAGVQVASETGGLDCPLLRFDGDRHPRHEALPGAAFALDVFSRQSSVKDARLAED